MNIPKDENAEQRILSAIITKPDAAFNLGNLSPDHFYNEKNRDVFKVCQKLIREDKAVDLVSVSAAKTKDSLFDDTYIVALTDVFSTVATLNVSIDSVIDKFRKRRLIEISNETVGSIQQEELSSDELLEKITHDVADIVDDSMDESFDICDLSNDYKQYLKDNKLKIENSQGGIIGLPTGIAELDKIIDGLQESSLYVIGAMTSGGKSAQMINMVSEILNSGKKVSIYSLEMGANAIINRMMGLRTGFDASKIKRLDVDTKVLSSEIKKISKQGLKIYNSDFSDIDKMIMSMISDARRGQTDIVFIDYIQMTKFKNFEDRVKLEYLMTELRRFVNKTKVPIVALTQLNNASVDDPNKESHGFAGSGSIAQRATAAWTLKPEVPKAIRKEMHSMGLPLPVKIEFNKNQEGPVTYCNVSFLGKTGKFESVNDEEFNAMKAKGDELMGGGDF